jgi:GAF domain-containing protein
LPRKKKANTTCQLEKELALLYEISSLVQVSPTHNETFEKILRLIEQVIDFRSASLYLISPETGQLEEISKIGRSVELISFVKFDMGKGISGWVAKEKRPILLNNLRKQDDGGNTRSFMSVPIVFEDELIGVFNFAHDQVNAFEERDMQIVGIIAAETAVTIERLIYEHKLENKNKQIREIDGRLNQAHAGLAKLEKEHTAADIATALSQEINNPLAIIAGNAQFLLMTMKNSNSSIIKRLQAIDKEAAAIAQVTEKFRQNEISAGEEYVRRDTRKIIKLEKSATVGEIC